MGAPVSASFRGSRQLEDIFGRMTPLAHWLQTFRPTCKTLTLSRRDFETLRRYCSAAQVLHDLTVSPDGALYWRGFELRPEPVLPNPKPQIRP